MRAEIPNFQQKYKDVKDLCLKWDLIKMEIRGFAIKYSKNQAKQRKLKKFIFQNKITNSTKKLKHIPTTSKLLMKFMLPDPALET